MSDATHRTSRSFVTNNSGRTALTWEELDTALVEQWCNGCGQPRSRWGPICPGMLQGDYTHFHSREWWRGRVDTRTAALQRTPTAVLEAHVDEWVRNG